MYSFNFDYIFNVVYNILLAIRYVILFWIIRISPVDYLEDHKYDAWDGLRDRGWINSSQGAESNVDPNAATVYLGADDGVKDFSWWDTFKHNIFGWGEDTSSMSTTNTESYNVSPNDVNFAIEKVNNDPWFSNLKFSIQNPILAFCADVLSVLAFFTLLILIYSMMQWLIMTLTPIRESKEKARQEKLLAKKQSKQEAFTNLDKVEENIIETMPAGIPGLPIFEEDLSLEEINEIHKEENLLLNYKAKNFIPYNGNKIVKREIDNLQDNKENNKQNNKENNKTIELSEKEKENFVKENELISSYKENWNRVVDYLSGEEEALWKIGIIEADNLLDTVLSDRGYIGLTLSDKLKKANFNSIDLAWSAHKVRNRIAHDSAKFVLSERIARNTLELYRSVFKEFKILE